MFLVSYKLNGILRIQHLKINPFTNLLLFFTVLQCLSYSTAIYYNNVNLRTDFLFYLEGYSEVASFADSSHPNKTKTSKTMKNYNGKCQKQTRMVKENDVKSGSIWDTLTQDDIVRNQYSLLPYPAVSNNDILRLRNHYSSKDRDSPLFTAPSESLELLNHFLYRGRNNFRSVKFKIIRHNMTYILRIF